MWGVTWATRQDTEEPIEERGVRAPGGDARRAQPWTGRQCVRVHETRPRGSSAGAHRGAWAPGGSGSTRPEAGQGQRVREESCWPPLHKPPQEQGKKGQTYAWELQDVLERNEGRSERSERHPMFMDNGAEMPPFPGLDATPLRSSAGFFAEIDKPVLKCG